MIVRSIDIDRGGEPDFVLVFKTTKAVDSKKVLEFAAKKSGEKEKTEKYEGATYYVFPSKQDGKSIVLHFPTDRIVLMAPSDTTLKNVLRDSKKPSKNAAIARGVQMASAGRHTFVAAFEIKKAYMDKIPPDAFALTPNLKDLNGSIFAGTLTKDLALEMVLTFPTKDIAAKAKTDVESVVTLGKNALKAKGDLPAGYGKFMDSLKVEHKGVEVVVTGKLELEINDLMKAMPFGRGFGAVQDNRKVAVAQGKAKADDMDFGPPPLGKPAVGPRPLALRVTSINNLREIALAMHEFNANFKALPNHAIRNPQGGAPLLSWRVALLPYLQEGELYKQIRLNEPWDSNHNRQFWNKMPRVYQMPGSAGSGTYYQVFRGDQSAFPATKKPADFNNLVADIKITDIVDGTSNTLFLVEAADPVNWMEPADIPFQMGDKNLPNRLGNHWGNNTFVGAFADGTARPLRRQANWDVLQALVTRNGGENVDPNLLTP